MKLLRYGPSGHEKPGLLDADGRIRDLSSIVSNIDSGVLAPSRLEHLRKFDPAKLPLVRGTPRLGVPYTGIGKFIAIGLNYSDHAAESGMPVPSEPIVFMKATTCITGPNDGIVLPKGSTKTDWEVELGVVIGARAQYVDKADALKYVAGYTVVNDISDREFHPNPQRKVREKDGFFDWLHGKWHDSFCPIGPCIVSADAIPDPQKLEMKLTLNGKLRQDSSTAYQIFPVAAVIEFLSSFVTLEPGDIISTGTPAGVGNATGTYLKPGDRLEATIRSIGTLVTLVVAE